jgi:hypothetical protein
MAGWRVLVPACQQSAVACPATWPSSIRARLTVKRLRVGGHGGAVMLVAAALTLAVPSCGTDGPGTSFEGMSWYGLRQVRCVAAVLRGRARRGGARWARAEGEREVARVEEGLC